MITFIIVGGIGLLMLLVSLVADDLLDIGDGAVSGTSLGAGLLVFGAIGSIVTVNDMPTGWAYAASGVFGVLTLVGVQPGDDRLLEVVSRSRPTRAVRRPGAMRMMR